jgi:hypothetical protein
VAVMWDLGFDSDWSDFRGGLVESGDSAVGRWGWAAGMNFFVLIFLI